MKIKLKLFNYLKFVKKYLVFVQIQDEDFKLFVSLLEKNSIENDFEVSYSELMEIGIQLNLFFEENKYEVLINKNNEIISCLNRLYLFDFDIFNKEIVKNKVLTLNNVMKRSLINFYKYYEKNDYLFIVNDIDINRKKEEEIPNYISTINRINYYFMNN